MKLTTAFCLLLVCCFTGAPAIAQSLPSSPQPVTIPPAVPAELRQGTDDIYATPPTFQLLPKGPQAHPGSVWLRSADDGLHLFVRVQADQDITHWAQEKSEVLASDHVEIWLATTTSIQMPPIGWGNQFGTETLNSEKDCAGRTDSHTGSEEIGVKNCLRWFHEQQQYREILPRLFTRQWLISPNPPGDVHIFEDFASSAYAALGRGFFSDELPAVLEPRDKGELKASLEGESRPETRHDAAGNPYPYNHQTGYRLHLFIPYTAFPPTQQLKLQDLYLMVDVFSAAPEGHKMGDFATTSAARVWGKPESFNHVRLTAPRTFWLTPCQQPLQATDLYGENYTSWFFPTAPTKDIKETFALIDPAGGYMYDPASVSPEAQVSTYFWKTGTDGATVCGPQLSWQKGSAIKRSEFTVDPRYFQTRILPDGWTLVRSGPFTTTHSAFGSGECGSCPIAHFNIFAISPSGEITTALNIDQDLSGEGGNPDGADFAIEPDWKRITFFTNDADETQPNAQPDWASTTYCLAGHTYGQCGQSKHIKPPNPPNFPDLTGGS